MRTLSLSLFIAALAASARAQDLTEAYNLSNTTALGTARSIGFGGALGSIGGDFGVISVNPAGLGIYRTSEIAATPSLRMNYSTSAFQGNTTTDNGTDRTLNHVGMVLTEAPKGKRYDRRKWKSAAFAFGMNRIADLTGNYNYSGANYSSSASLLFEADANRTPANLDAPGSLAYMGSKAHLLTHPLTSYYTAVPFSGGITQSNIVSERGGINELVVALGGNYKERILIGATLGFPVFRYHRISDYTETVLPGNTNNLAGFSSFTYNNDLSINGSGVNLKLGTILKLTNFFRIGAAFHTPTIYTLSEVTDYGISSVVGGNRYSLSTANILPQQRFDYSFITPYKAVLSASLVIKKLGFVTADYEVVDYSTMQFRYQSGTDASGTSNRVLENNMNNSIRATYQAATNIRLGAEIKLGKSFMARAGAGYYSNPYKTGPSMERFDVSAGLGFRTKHFFADFGLLNSTYKFSELAYSDVDYRYVATANSGALAPMATVQPVTNNVALTVGFKF